MLHPGLYEQLINRALRQELDTIPPERKSVAPVDPAEAAEVLSRYIAEAAKRALSGMAEGRGDVADQVALANRLIDLLPETGGQSIDDRAEQLMALLAEQDPALALGRTASDVCARRPPSPRAACSPALCTSHRCSPSSRRRSPAPTASTCWCPSSSGAACG